MAGKFELDPDGVVIAAISAVQGPPVDPRSQLALRGGHHERPGASAART